VDPFVGIMKGVIAERAPGVPIVDLVHELAPQDVLAGALVLRAAVPYFPRGTVHVAVVDPGVGTARRALCVETDDAYLVGPDNGVLSLAPGRVRRIVELTDVRFHLAPRSATFHGRDVFAPVAAALASGIPAAMLGVETDRMQRLALPDPKHDAGRVTGEVIHVDRYGNLATNVGAADLAGGVARIVCGGRRIAGLSETYGGVPAGELAAVVNSWGMLEIALRDGNAGATLGIGIGAPVVVFTS
jgi:S-adenosylmethionine hydrolase